jgi:hypothetical protein
VGRVIVREQPERAGHSSERKARAAMRQGRIN